jgi:hypothetical protein
MHQRTKSEACEDPVTAWAHLSYEVLLTGWDLYDDDGWDVEDLFTKFVN